MLAEKYDVKFSSFAMLFCLSYHNLYDKINVLIGFPMKYDLLFFPILGKKKELRINRSAAIRQLSFFNDCLSTSHKYRFFQLSKN